MTWDGAKSFVGGDQDPTGLIHEGAREYDASVGAFISRDPVVDPKDPPQMNGYAYADNNPIVHSDPTGLKTDPFADVHGNTKPLNAPSYNVPVPHTKPATSHNYNFPGPSHGHNYNFPGPHPKKTDPHESKLRKTAAFVAHWSTKIGGYVGWVPFCGWCSTVGVALGIIAALAYSVLHEWSNMFKALVGTGVNLFLGGIKLTKGTEFLEGGAGDFASRELQYQLRRFGYDAYEYVGKRRSGVERAVERALFSSRAISAGVSAGFNEIGNLLTSPISPGQP